jgi:hypothetical protein
VAAGQLLARVREVAMILAGIGIALLVAAFYMGDTSMGGPALVVQIVFALHGVGFILWAIGSGIVGLFT